MITVNLKHMHTLRLSFILLTAAAMAIATLFAAHAAVADDEKQSAKTTDATEVYVRMTTTKGDVYLELNGEKAPITVKNFVQYVEDEFYDGTIFHRVIENFMIQGGGFTPEMRQKPTREQIKNEWRNGLKNERGSIAMARTADPDSASAQFFINVRNNHNLDQPISGGAGYAVFGKVIHGMDVVDAIRKVETGVRGGHPNVPLTPIVIERVRIISKEEAERAKNGDEEEKSDSD